MPLLVSTIFSLQTHAAIPVSSLLLYFTCRLNRRTLTCRVSSHNMAYTILSPSARSLSRRHSKNNHKSSRKAQRQRSNKMKRSPPHSPRSPEHLGVLVQRAANPFNNLLRKAVAKYPSTKVFENIISNVAALFTWRVETMSTQRTTRRVLTSRVMMSEIDLVKYST